MGFTTPLFLFFFLPLALCGYWLLPARVRLQFLLGASLFFYAWGERSYALVLAVAITVNYLLTLLVDRCERPPRRLAMLFVAITLNLAGLFAFKYPALAQWLTGKDGAAALKSAHFPLGLSFFTFQAIAYAIDVYHRKYAPALNPLRFSLFLALFPKISAGPIIRYQEVAETFAKPAMSLDDCAYGAKRFIVGLGKKLLIADTLARTADQIFAVPTGELTAPLAWLGITCYTLQLYFDFSGYSDMAIGLGRMFGFTFLENFNYPYISRSLTEFWRRWHISLSTWFRDYLYTPLLYSLMTDKIRRKIAAGQYRTNYRSLFCVVVVFTLCGWWHGSTWNFVAWGLLHGLILAVESWKLGKLLKKLPAFAAHGYALLAIMLCWVVFRSQTLGDAAAYLAALAGLGSGTGIHYSLALFLNNELLLVLSLAVLGAMPVMQSLRDRLTAFSPPAAKGWPAAVLETAAVGAVLVLSLLAVATSTYQPFIYFRF